MTDAGHKLGQPRRSDHDERSWQAAPPKAPRGLDKALFQKLVAGDWIDRRQNLIVIGPTGTGKSHLSLALGVEAVKAGRSVLHHARDLIGALAKAEREGALREKIRLLCRFALLIVDEIGYLPVIPGGGNLFFQLVNARYEKGAMILTSTAVLQNGARFLVTPWSQRPFWTGFFTTASLSRSRVRAIASGNTPTSCPSTFDPSP